MILSPMRCELLQVGNVSFFMKSCASLCSAVSKIENFNLPSSDTKVLKVGIIGTPNAGKSTIINNLMDRKVCPTSSKVHTTRAKSTAIFTTGDSQIIFLDTPGLVNKKEQTRYNLANSFLRDSKNVLQEADVIGVIHDVSNAYTREKLDIKIIKLLEFHKSKPSFLVFNKIDIIKSKRKLLDITRQVTDNCVDGKPIPGSSIRRVGVEVKEDKGWPYFQEIFMVSALSGDGLADVKNYLVKNAKPGKWLFPEQVWTDQSAESIISNSVHAKLLDFLPQEIPYSLKPELEYFDVSEEGVITTVVLVKCPSSRISKLVAGAADGKLKQITQSVQADLQDAFHNYVRIKIVLDPPYE